LVGTVFVNSITNLLCSFAKNAKLSIETSRGTKIEKIHGGFVSSNSNNVETIQLSTLQYDQKKDVLIKLGNAAVLSFFKSKSEEIVLKLRFDQWNKSKTEEIEIHVTGITEAENIPDFEYVRSRFLLIDTLRDIIGKMSSSAQVSATSVLNKLISSLEGIEDDRIQALVGDAKGQITEAISKDEWWSRWGKHFLPSLMEAHLLQQCNNFKDPGIQKYGGPLFEKIRDEVEIIFNKLPPPEASRPLTDNSAPLTNMNAYYNYSGGCFDGNSAVLMEGNQQKLVKDIKKGDKVITHNGAVSEVQCALKMLCPSGSLSLVELEGGLRITAYHPVRVNQKWSFPGDIKPAQVVPCEAVYTFVLNQQSEHIMVINGIECVTLGHNKQEDIVRHAFFGSDAVVQEMKKMSGWEAGLIEMADAETCFVRDSDTNLVCGFNLGRKVMSPGA